MSAPELETVDLGRLPYAEALAVQRATHALVHAGLAPPTLILVEHNPVITLGARREVSASHIRALPAELAALGIEVHPSDRGGDVTYHGPGQLVAYPILRLSDFGLSLGGYVRLLERVAIETAAVFGVEAHRLEGAPGVWVDPPRRAGESAEPEKLCAVGVRVRQGVTMHGLALNVTTDLSHFDTIVPCGLAGRGVTSLRRLLGERTPAMATVRAALARAALESLQPLTPSPSGRGLG